MFVGSICEVCHGSSISSLSLSLPVKSYMISNRITLTDHIESLGDHIWYYDILNENHIRPNNYPLLKYDRRRRISRSPYVCWKAEGSKRMEIHQPGLSTLGNNYTIIETRWESRSAVGRLRLEGQWALYHFYQLCSGTVLYMVFSTVVCMYAVLCEYLVVIEHVRSVILILLQ